MNDSMPAAAALKRFGWVVRGEPVGPDPLCDIPIRTTPEALALPTVGAIVPNWLLIVPRQCAVSLADLSSDVRSRVLEFGHRVGQEMRDAGEPVFFEHGARTSGNVVGCGVDQAHLHVLATGIDLLGSALADRGVDWTEVGLSDPWQGLGNFEYYFVQSSGKAFVGRPHAPQSQYFRKLIARAAGVPSEWDYKAWPNHENVRQTYDRFNGRDATVCKA